MTKTELMNLMDKSDRTILRCIESDAPIPYAWILYRRDLRNLIATGTGVVPTQPSYPAGT